MDEIRLYENKEVRSIWDEEQEEWYFSVVDVVGVLSESKNPTDYLKKMRKRDEQLALYIGTNCPQVAMKSSNGKKRKNISREYEGYPSYYPIHPIPQSGTI